MPRFPLLGIVLIVSSALGQDGSNKPWSDLKAKREMLPGLHQEFELSRTYSRGSSNRTIHERVVIDVANRKWRERSISGSCDCVRIFDGQNLFLMEADGNEFERIHPQWKSDNFAPGRTGHRS